MSLGEHRVFFLSEDDFYRDNEAKINPSDSHHICHVLRLKIGDYVVVVTNQGKYKARLIEDNNDECCVCLEDCLQIVQAPKIKIHLLQSLPKLKKMDEIIEKSTELGVYAIHPFLSQRSSVNSSVDLQSKEDRWKRIALAASKQSRRFSVPAIYPVQKLESMISNSSWPEETIKIIFWEQEEQKRLLHLFPLVSNLQEIVICIGPEGGFTVAEVSMMIEAGFQTFSLGNQILRTETAGPFAVGFIINLSE